MENEVQIEDGVKKEDVVTHRMLGLSLTEDQALELWKVWGEKNNMTPEEQRKVDKTLYRIFDAGGRITLNDLNLGLLKSKLTEDGPEKISIPANEAYLIITNASQNSSLAQKNFHPANQDILNDPEIKELFGKDSKPEKNNALGQTIGLLRAQGVDLRSAEDPGVIVGGKREEAGRAPK